MISIEKYLKDIYTEFENSIIHMDSLCAIRSLNFMDGNVPDYNNTIIQQFYLLKYAYAYTYEYYVMYSQAMRQLECHDTISVVSVGCGALIDYNSLKELPEIRNKMLYYTGIDKIDWGFKPNLDSKDKVDLKIGMTTSTYFQSIEYMSADIYMFPKSISELTLDEINLIANCFLEKYNQKDKFCICVSLRNTLGHREEDMQKIDIIGNAIVANGYSPTADNYLYYIFPEGKGINAYEKNYRYPESVVGELSSISTRCKARFNCIYAEQCGRYLNRYPILRTSEICYKVMTFERRRVS